MKFAKLKKTLIGSLMLTLLVSAISSTEAADNNFESIKGKDRVETSIRASRTVKSDTLVVASAYQFADSLSAYNIASKYKAKLILVDNDTNLSSEIKAQNISKVYVIGGEKSVSEKVLKSIYDTIGKNNVTRVAGKNRYETNIMSLEKAGYKSVGVADGRNFSDALSSMGLLYSKGLGLMLVYGSKDYKTDKKVVYTFGGENSVKKLLGKRISRKNRYETNLLINKEGKFENTVVVDGRNFADSMSSINLLYDKPTSIILFRELDTKKKSMLSDLKNVYLVGGSLGEKVEKEIKEVKTNNPKKDETNKNTSTSSSRSSSPSRSSSSSSNKDEKTNNSKDDKEKPGSTTGNHGTSTEGEKVNQGTTGNPGTSTEGTTGNPGSKPDDKGKGSEKVILF